MAELEPPPSLKPKIRSYLEQSKVCAQAGLPVISYYCNVHALTEAMAMRAKIPKADMAYVIALMDHVEAQKKGLELEDAQVQIENRADELFMRADNADRANPTVPRLQTAKDFMAASTLLEVCKEFGELPDDLAEKVKYGKWRFLEICKAAKEKRAPVPPRSVEPEEADVGGGLGEEGSSSSALPTEPPPMHSLSLGPAVPPSAESGSYFDLPPAAPPPGAPPSYLDLPPSAPQATPYAQPPPYAPPQAPPQLPPQVPQHSPASAPLPPYVAGGQQGSFDAPPPPQHAPYPPQQAAVGGYAPPPPGYAPQRSPQYAMPPVAHFQPSRETIVEAARLAQSAASSLQFQDTDTAINSLQRALHLLTTPPPPEPPAEE